jgi:phosphatidylglycerol:prolipoprotein diacylglycerol transferase
VILEIGPIVIGSYAIMLTLAFLIGTIVAARRAKKCGILPHEIVTLVVIIIIASIIGSRALFILEHFHVFLKDPISIFYVWEGGLSYYGGLLLAIIAFTWWLKSKNISALRMLDIFSPSVTLGFFFVRIGCFLNGCCFGKPTDVPWGVVFPPESPAGQVYKDTPIHPSQLYSSLSGLLGFFVLLGIEKRFRLDRRAGLLFFLFLIISALWRFIIEFYRYQNFDATMVFWFTKNQVYSLVIFAFSIIMVALIYKGRISL